MRYCKFCGNRIGDQANFCRTCGKQVGNFNMTPVMPLQQQPVAKPQKKSPKKKILAVVISLVLVAAILITTFWKPGFYWMIRYSGAVSGMEEFSYDPDKDYGLEDYYQMPDISPDIAAQAADYEPCGTGSAVTWSDSEIKGAKVITGKVTVDKPVAEMDGIKVDFGNCNISGDSTVSVRVPESKSEPAEFLRNATLYDLTLTQKQEADSESREVEISEFVEPVTVTVPYTAKENTYPVVQYYNKAESRWEIVPYDINEKEGTIDFYVTHFSPYATFEYEIPEYDSLTPNLKICVDGYKIISTARQRDTVQLYVDALQGESDKIKSEYTKIIMEEVGNVVSVGGMPISIGDVAVGSAFSKITSGFAGVIGAVTTTYCVISEMSVKETIPDALKVLMDHGVDIAAATASLVGVGATIAEAAGVAAAATLSTVASIVGVVLTGMSIMIMIYNDAMKTQYGGYSDSTELAYYTFNKMVSFDGTTGNFSIDLTHQEHLMLDQIAGGKMTFKNICAGEKGGSAIYAPIYNRLYMSDIGWARVMQYCKQKYGLEKAIPEFEKRVDTYCEFFWQQHSYVKHCFFRYGYASVPGNGSTSELYQDPSNHAEYSKKQKKEIMELSRNLIKGVIKELVLEVRRQAHESVQRYTDEVNSEVIFELNYKDKKGNPLTLNDSPYKGKYIVLDVDSSKWDRAKNPAWVVNMDSTELFRCTYGAYTLAGEPAKLLVYENEAEYLSGGKVLAELGFSFERPKTIVNLDPLDIFGDWDIELNMAEMGSAITDEYTKMYIDAMKAQGVDMSAYENAYKEAMKNATGLKKGVMTITDLGNGKVKATINYEDKTRAATVYEGTYDSASRTLDLKVTSAQSLDPPLKFTIKEGDPLSFETNEKESSEIVNYEFTLTGKKKK